MKPLLHLLLFLSFCLSGKGQNQNSEIQLGLSNDSWGGGSTAVYDDLRSFGFQFAYFKENRIKIESKYSYLTNRFDIDADQRKSLNEWSTDIAFPIVTLNEEKKDYLWFKPGLLFTGNLLGNKIQNLTHRSFRVVTNEMPYYHKLALHLSIGFIATKTLFSKQQANGNSVKLKLEHHFDMKFSFPLSLNFKTGSSLQLSSSYTLSRHYQIGNHLLDRVIKTESGLNFNLKLTSRNIFYYFDVFPESGFSTGGIGLRFAKQPQSSKTENLNFDIAVSMLNKGYGYNFKYGFVSGEVWNRKTKIIVNHHFHTLLRNFVPEAPMIKGHGNQFTIGVEIALLKTKARKRIVSPYTNLSFGNKVISIYSQNVEFENRRSHHFTINNDIGFDFNIPLPFNWKMEYLNLTLYHRLIFMNSLTPEKESTNINTHNSPYASIQESVGFGFKFNL